MSTQNNDAQHIARNIGAGALAGLIAGLSAAWAMNAGQALVPVASRGDPATVHAARALNRLRTPKPLARARKQAAGNAVHYVFGAVLGAAYGAMAERWPRLSAGFGIPFGLAVAAIADEALVPALGLSAPPWRLPAKLHAYGAASHMLFGSVAELVRKIVRPLF